jgi:hypothetical protein
VNARSPSQKECSREEPGTVPLIQPAGLQQNQPQEPGRQDLSLGPRPEAQRQRLARSGQEAYREQQAQFDGNGKNTAHNRDQAQHEEQHDGSGFRVVDRESHPHQPADPSRVDGRMRDQRQVEILAEPGGGESQFAEMGERVSRVLQHQLVEVPAGSAAIALRTVGGE